MNKSELLDWLRDQHTQWERFIDQFSLEQLEQPNVTGAWSMKDTVTHMTGWNRRLVAYIEAAKHGLPHPPAQWPATLQTDDEINAWIYATNRTRSAQEVLDDSKQVFQQLFAVVESLPDDVRIETVRGSSGQDKYLVWLGDNRYPAGEFFDHFHDDHEADMRAWLAQTGKQ